MTQVQCPNCGGFKVGSTVDPITEVRTVPMDEFTQFLRYGAAVIFAILAILVPMGALGTANLSVSILFGVPSLLLFWVASRDRTMKKTVRVGNVYHFSCLLCGYCWDSQEGHSQTDIRTRPDLIAKGDQRLREEEERRRRMWD